MEVKPGQIYWLKTESDILHPHLVVKLGGEIATVCSLTTNMKKLNMPGIVVLEAGEGGLEKQSIVEAYNLTSVVKSKLIEYIGTISSEKLLLVLNAVNLSK